MPRRDKLGKSGLGKSILRARYQGSRKQNEDTWLHTSDLNDGRDWARLHSVTEQGDLQEFLHTAEMADVDFTAEKLNLKVISAFDNDAIVTESSNRLRLEAEAANKDLLTVPRRPKWEHGITAAELTRLENDSFLVWRRSLATLQENDNLILTPCERNLEVWRQLWRVIERCELVVQIVDARNPLMFRCADLEKYVKEVSPRKSNLLLINKADMLTVEQRRQWADYFDERGVEFIFWSAALEQRRVDVAAKEARHAAILEPVMTLPELLNAIHPMKDNDVSEDRRISTKEVVDKSNLKRNGFAALRIGDEDDEDENKSDNSNDSKESDDNDDDDDDDDDDDIEEDDLEDEDEVTRLALDIAETEALATTQDDERLHVLTGAEVKTLLRSKCPQRGDTVEEKKAQAAALAAGGDVMRRMQIGLVGYPNVGKSSTINALCAEKRVAVACTPGKTKHFQTILLDDDICLCDCPGLVFPSFATTKSDMVCNGVLPIDQLRDHVGPTTVVCQRIPRDTLETFYGIVLPTPPEGHDPNRPPTAEELLGTYGSMRGYMTSHGQPDMPRSARYVLKDYMKGRLLWCAPPPGIDWVTFNTVQVTTNINLLNLEGKGTIASGQGAKARRRGLPAKSLVDEEFFRQEGIRAHVKGQGRKGGKNLAKYGIGDEIIKGKPHKKHNNRNKREKTRRVFGF